MDNRFAKETIALMKDARICALDLGCGHVSTLHLFLADCRRNDPDSIRDFAFPSAETLQSFYESQRVGEAGVFDSLVSQESLPITVELEQTVIEAQKRFGQSIRPFHLFLTASRLKDTLFYTVLEPKEGLYERLLDYYAKKGLIAEEQPERKTLWQRFRGK